MRFSGARDSTIRSSWCVVNSYVNLTFPCRQAVKAKPTRKVYVHMDTLNSGQTGCLALQKAEHLQNVKAKYIKNIIHTQAAPQLTLHILGPDGEALRNSIVKSKYFFLSFKRVKDDLTSSDIDPDKISVMLKRYFCAKVGRL